MASIKDLVNAIDINDLKYQVLNHGSVRMTVKGGNKKYLSVTFETDASHINGKEAIILWVDDGKFKKALDKVKYK